MPVKESKITYTASDGREFESKAAAEAHEKLLELKKDFEIAKWKFNTALAKAFKTKDGHPIQIGYCSEFYVIAYGMGMPQVARKTLSCDNVQFQERHYNDDADLEIVEFVRDEQERGYSNRYRRAEYRASDLYKDERAAKLDLVALQEEWLAQETAQLEKTKENLKRGYRR